MRLNGYTVTGKKTLRPHYKARFCCDSIANLSPGTICKIGRENWQERFLHRKHNRYACPSSCFSPGWKFQPGLNLSPHKSQTSYWRNLFRKQGWSFSPASRPEFSARTEIRHVISSLTTNYKLEKVSTQFLPKILPARCNSCSLCSVLNHPCHIVPHSMVVLLLYVFFLNSLHIWQNYKAVKYDPSA